MSSSQKGKPMLWTVNIPPPAMPLSNEGKRSQLSAYDNSGVVKQKGLYLPAGSHWHLVLISLFEVAEASRPLFHEGQNTARAKQSAECRAIQIHGLGIRQSQNVNDKRGSTSWSGILLMSVSVKMIHNESLQNCMEKWKLKCTTCVCVIAMQLLEINANFIELHY